MLVGETPSGCQRRPQSSEFNKCCAHCRLLWVQRKAQGTLFPEKGEKKCNETVNLLGLLQQNLQFSTLAAHAQVNQTTDVLFQENIRGAFVRQNNRMHLFPFCALGTSSRFHDAWIRLQGVAGPPCSRIPLGLFLPSDPQPPMIFPDLFYTLSHNRECSRTHGIHNFPFNLLIIYISYGRESHQGNHTLHN